jgi:uncharacterized membrane protein YdbT with pleckstrin-like domain
MSEPVKTPPATAPNTKYALPLKWSYSGKAMRFLWFCLILFSVILLAAGVILSWKGTLAGYFSSSWIAILAVLLIVWGWYYAVYFYRTLFVKYELTDSRLYNIDGFITKKRNSMELVFIEDMRLTQHLWDRLFNGGVGTIEIFSSSDKTNTPTGKANITVIYIIGVENPQDIFELIDTLRSDLRKKRSILS